MQTPSFTFLPEPRQPLIENGSEPPEGLHPRLDQHRQAMADLRSEVNAAIQAVYAGRPGGDAWRAAADADQAAVLEGRQVKVWQLARLLEGDYSRWARASAEARTAVKRANLLLAELKEGRDTILSSLAVDRMAMVTERRPQLVALWGAAQGSSRGQALVAIEDLEPVNARIAIYGQTHMWLSSEAAAPFKNFGGNEFPNLTTDRAARIDRGHWVASLAVTGSVILTIPDADQIEWPADFTDGEKITMPTSPIFKAIESARNGGPGVVFQPDVPESARRIGSLGIGAAVARPPRRGR